MINGRLKFLRPTPRLRKLLILTCIDENPRLSQRRLAKRVGMSITMTNNYVAEMIKEGLIQARGSTNRSMEYRLTARGHAEKGKMIQESSREIIRFYGMAKAEFAKKLKSLSEEGLKRIVFYGAAESGELAYNASRGLTLEILGVVDSDPLKQGLKFGELCVLPPSVIESLSPDAVVVTSSGHGNEICELLRPLENKGIKVRNLWNGGV